MKHLAVVFLLLMLLTGCSMAPDEHLYIAPHADSSTQAGPTAAVTAENYPGLKNAILSMVRTGQTEGVIHVSNYDGIVEEDLAEAAYEVSKLDPLGAFAVDYMTHDCTQIVSYYEIRINITFRRTVQEINEITSVSTQNQLEEKLQQAVEEADDRLTLRLSSYRAQDQDIPAFVEEYCLANPGTVMEMPTVTTAVYPESGSVRILEINFAYTHTPEELQSMRDAVHESIDGAAEYIRYRQTDWDKSQLLFTYLMERFHYAAAETATPLYSALCAGVADPTGLSQAWQLICDQAGLECRTVSGMRAGEPYVWNIVSTDGYYRHLDLARCVLETGTLVLGTDADMTDYYWNTELLPACEPLPDAEVPIPEGSEQTPEEPELPAEEPETPEDAELPEEDTPPELPEETPPEADPEQPPAA